VPRGGGARKRGRRPPSFLSLQLTLVGKLASVSEHASSILLQLDDGTGVAAVKFWADDAGDDAAAAARRADWRAGAYVRVHGHVRSFDGKPSIVAFNVRPVTDHNEVRCVSSCPSSGGRVVAPRERRPPPPPPPNRR